MSKTSKGDLAVIILAAGLGTRMRSARPKVMHEVAGRSMLGHVLDTARRAGISRAVVVTGPDMPEVEAEARRWHPGAQIAIQRERKGTAHAVSFAEEELADFDGTVLVLYGDVPLVREQTLQGLAAAVREGARKLCVLGFRAADPHGYGRLILDADGQLESIREELDTTPEERAINLCNSGIIAIDNRLLWELLPKIGDDNAKGEFYLTDIIGLARAAGLAAGHVECAEEEVLGVNDRAQLARAEGLMQQRLRARALEGGATLVDPATVYFSHDTHLGRDVVVEPWVWFGPGVRVADGVRIHANSYLEQAEVGAGARIGPFARLRPGADVRPGAKIGNFVEIKKAVVEEGAKVNHFTYVGDARIGARANIGAGTITCNYDGFSKHFTDIGADAFIGSNTSLVAPVKVGDGAWVGSGSVITRDVAADALALARGRQVEKPGWARKFRQMMQARKARGG